MMKTIRFFFLIFAVLLVGSLLTSCAGTGVAATNWPGMTVDTDGQTIYLANAAHVYALNSANGTEKWRYPSKAENKLAFYAPPALTGDGQLIAGAYNNQLYSLNRENGAQNWVFSQVAHDYYYFVAGPSASEEQIYAPSTDKNLYAVNSSGALQWQFAAEDALWGTPATDGKNIYLASMDHRLYALDATTGQVVWKTDELGGSMAGTPTLSPQGVLYVGTFNSEVIALNATDGEILWRMKAKGWVWTGPLLQDDVLYFGDLAGSMFAISAKDGKELWSLQPDDAQKNGISGRPVILGDTIYFATRGGALYAVDVANGSLRWSKAIGGQLYADLATVDEMILLASVKTDAILIALDANGNQKWAFVPAK
jgi:outer membrane protein assembly factor BamB